MKNIAVITVIYKYPQEKINKFILNVSNAGIPRKSIFIKDNSVQNIGYAPAINIILKKQMEKYDYFFIINPDVVLEKNCLNFLMETIKSNPKLGIVGPRVYDESNKYFYDGGEIERNRYSANIIKRVKKKLEESKILKYVDFVSGSAMLIKKEVFKKVGFFSEDYFLYYEDLDFCLRAKKNGFYLAVDSRGRIKHFESSMVGKFSPAKYYYMARNHLLFVERFAPFSIKIRELIRMPKTLYEAREKKFELQGIKDYFFRRFGIDRKILSEADLQ